MNGMAQVPDESRRLAVDVLLAEYAHLEQSFRWNEEMGERRVNLVLTLMTVTAAATGLVIDSADVPIAARLRGAGVVAIALLVLGLVTNARLVRRNVATDEYKKSLDDVRNRLIRLSSPHLQGYAPWPKRRETKIKLKRLLGLTLLMSAMNSILTVAAVLLLARPPLSTASVVGVAIFLAAGALQLWLAAILEARLRREVGLGDQERDVGEPAN
jgi:hypothetical protein